MKADKSDRIRCAETSAAPTRHGVPVAYIEATTKLSSGRPLGATLAAAIVLMSLTPMLVLAEFADRRHLPEPFDLDLIRQFDHKGSAVAQLPVPVHVVAIPDRVRKVAGRAARFLQQRDIGLSPRRRSSGRRRKP